MSIVCVDFDGVIASWNHGTFDSPGPPISGAAAFLKALRKTSDVIVCTCRTNPDLYGGASRQHLADKIWGWLERYGMAQYVNSVHVGAGKPLASCYIDDRAVYCAPEIDPESYAYALARAASMCDNELKQGDCDGNGGLRLVCEA